MEDFYRRLAKGEAKADALRGAKLDAFRRDPNLAPRFWAAFILMGDGNGTVPLIKVPFWRRLFRDSPQRGRPAAVLTANKVGVAGRQESH
jgi:hypothetical protein